MVGSTHLAVEKSRKQMFVEQNTKCHQEKYTNKL
jgi:hypothetical protein